MKTIIAFIRSIIRAAVEHPDLATGMFILGITLGIIILLLS